MTTSTPTCASCGTEAQPNDRFCRSCGSTNWTGGGGGGPEVEFDKRDQYALVQPWVMPQETLFAVYDCKGAGTGFVALTDRRVLYYDKAFMRSRKALVSVPYSRIASVSSIDEGALVKTGKLAIRPMGGDEVEFEFRGEKAHKAYAIIMRELLQHE